MRVKAEVRRQSGAQPLQSMINQSLVLKHLSEEGGGGGRGVNPQVE